MDIFNADAVPQIVTERLVLRGPRASDFEDFAAMWMGPGFTRYILPEPFTRGAIWGKFLRDAGHWAMQGWGYWIATERESGAFAGQIGFADFKRDMDFDGHGRPEIGWAMQPRLQGKGYTTEAVRAAVDWGEARFPGACLYCVINPENAASLRVAEKCGFSETARATLGGSPIVVLER